MKSLLRQLVFISLFSSLFFHGIAQSPSEEDWISLFNGHDLTGWDIKITGFPIGENYKQTFLVDSNILKINYDNYDRFNNEFGHLYYQESFSHYRLRVEYRFVGDQLPGGASWNVRNSGVMVHAQSAASVELHQHFPVSIELQFLGGLDSGERPTCNVCTPGTAVEIDSKINYQHCINSTSKTYHGDQWVMVEMLVLGDSVIQHIIDDEIVLSYEKPQIGGGFISKSNGEKEWENFGIAEKDYWLKKEGDLLAEGHIALQAESHPIHFRKVELLNLKGCTDPKATNYKSYFIKSDNSTCTYE